LSKKIPIIDDGRVFEEWLSIYMNDWLDINKKRGLCYAFPDGGNQVQRIDLLIDSIDIGNIGIECKSIFELGGSFSNGKIELSMINRIGGTGISQIERHHQFLKDTGRYGIFAIEMLHSKEHFLLPHSYLFDKIAAGDQTITFDEIYQNSYKIGSNGSLELFIQNKCGVR
jgi:hypothetical protein